MTSFEGFVSIVIRNNCAERAHLLQKVKKMWIRSFERFNYMVLAKKTLLVFLNLIPPDQILFGVETLL